MVVMVDHIHWLASQDSPEVQQLALDLGNPHNQEARMEVETEAGHPIKYRLEVIIFPQ